MGFWGGVLGDIIEKLFKAYGTCQACGSAGLTQTCKHCGSATCLDCYKANLAVFDREKTFKTFVFTCPLCGHQTTQKSMGLGTEV